MVQVFPVVFRDMPTYNVVMNQGITVTDLGNNSLFTGWGGTDKKLQSCSAVILVNTQSGAAGLYHFPAGDIDDDKGSQDVLNKMLKAVKPDQVWVCYGIDEVAHMKAYGGAPSQEFYIFRQKLKDWLKSKVADTAGVSEKAAKGGTACVSLANGVPDVSVKGEGMVMVTDLSGYQAGNYNNIGRIYWKE
jgi:hypothetical protein